MLTLNDQFETVSVPFDSWVNFHAGLCYLQVNLELNYCFSLKLIESVLLCSIAYCCWYKEELFSSS